MLIWLVVQCAHLEKYEFVNGKDDMPYLKWNIKKMIETTKQIQDVRVVASVPHLSNSKIWQVEASNRHEDH